MKEIIPGGNIMQSTQTTELTAGSAKCLDAIIKYMDRHGYAPSIREISEMTGYTSTCTISIHMNRLFRYGFLETESPSSPRAFRLGAKAKEFANAKTT